MKWKAFVSTASILSIALMVSITGCSQVSNPTLTPTDSKGTLTINVTDAPGKPEVTAILLNVSKIEIHKAVPDQTQEGEGEWQNIAVPENAGTFDLLQIKNVEQLLTETQIAPGLYTQIRLSIATAEVGLDNKDPKPAIVPSGVLKLVQPFEIVAGETTSLTLDFNADKSVNVTGNDQIHVKPVIKLLVKPPKGPKPEDTTQEQSQELAENFLKNSPTFVFDGIDDSINQVDITQLSSSATWQFTYTFSCAHAGYGDRTGQQLAQVITEHQIVIVVEQGSVTSAVVDNVWNEVTQEQTQETTSA